MGFNTNNVFNLFKMVKFVHNYCNSFLYIYIQIYMNRIVVLNSDEEYKSFYDKIIWAVCGRNRRRIVGSIYKYIRNTSFNLKQIIKSI